MTCMFQSLTVAFSFKCLTKEFLEKQGKIFCLRILFWLKNCVIVIGLPANYNNYFKLDYFNNLVFINNSL